MQHHKKVPQARLSQGLQPQKPPPQKNAPLSAAVESDVVGYTTITTTPGFNMVGVVFDGLAGKTATLKEILSGNIQDFDQIQIRDGKSGIYTLYTYESGSWYDESFVLSDNLELPPGSAFWFSAPSSRQITMKGVVLRGTYTQPCAKGLSMIGPGVPKKLALNGGIKWDNLAQYDTIQIRDGNDYVLFTYEDGKWWDETFQETTYEIPVGASIWLTTSSANATISAEGTSK